MAVPTFDQFAQRAASLYPQATEDQIREAFAARYGGDAVRTQGPSREDFAARARALYPDIGDDQIEEAYETKYGAGFLTESKRTLLSQAYAPLAQGLGAIIGGADDIFGSAVQGLTGVDNATIEAARRAKGGPNLGDVGYGMFAHGGRVREGNAPSADVSTSGTWDPYKLGQNVIGGLGQIAPAVLTGGASLAPLVAADAGSLATELEEGGMSAEEARMRAMAYAGASSLLERVGLGRLIPKRLPGRLVAGAQEAGTEIAQGVARSGAAGDPLLADLERTIAEEGLPAGLAAAALVPGGRRARNRAQEFQQDAGLTAADVPRETPDLPSPEPLADLRAQVAEIGKTRKAVLIPRGQEDFTGLPGLDVPTGRMVFQSPEDAAAFQQELAQGDPQAVIGEWTGAGLGKPTDPDAVVVQALNQQGQVVRESAVPKGAARETAQRFQQDFPRVQILTPAQALQRRQELLKGEQSAFSRLPEDELLRRTDPKAYLQKVDARPMPSLATLPKESSAYFTPSKTSSQVDPALLVSRPSSGATALKRMGASAEGKLDKRKPVTVKVDREGRMVVEDGNSTVAAARAIGAPVEADLTLDLADEKFRKYERALTGQARTSIAAQARDATAYQPVLNERVGQIAQAIGGELVAGTPKSASGFGRIAEKTILENDGDAEQLRDMARATILVDNKQQAQAALEAVLQKLGQAPGTSLRDTLLSADSFAEVLARDPYGYADIKLNVPAENGRVYEVQIASREMYEAKKATGHKLYEDGRSREGKIAESLRKIYGRKLTTAQMKKALAAGLKMFREKDPQMQRLYSKSRKIYQAALMRWFTSSSNASAVIGSPSAMMPEGVTNDQAPSAPMRAAPSPETTAGAPPTFQNVEPPGQPTEGLSAIPITSDASVARQSHRVITPGGQELEVRGRLVELDRLLASDNEGYPAILQPRERGKRAALSAQVQKIARELKPFVLGPSTTTAEGGPIVSPEGVVESGNGRIMALRLARDAHPENWRAYQEWVRTLGLDASGLADPVYVQERITPLAPEELRNYTADANESTAARLSPTEQAIADGRLLDEELMTLVRSGDMTQAQNTDFLRGFISKLPDAARNALLSADGRITPAGVQRAEAALVARAYGGTPEISTLLDRLYEDTTDETVKRITNALKLASARFVELKLAIETGRIPSDYDIGPSIVRAYDAVQRGRRNGMTPEQIAAQADLLDGSGLREAILKTFYRKLEPGLKNEWPQDRIAGQLQYYAVQAVSQPGAQGSMFAAVGPLEILDTAHRIAGEGKAPSDAEQFARRGTEPRGEGRLQAASLRQLIQPITSNWNQESAPRIRIVQSAWELPSHILESLGTDINGATDLERGMVYLVADNIAGRWQAERVLIHEAVGHFGFDRLYGDRFPGMVDQVMALVGKDAEITRIEGSIRERYGALERPTMAAEIIAHLAERSPKHPLSRRVLAQLREILRQLGFRLNLSKADLVYLLQRSAESMRERGAVKTVTPAAPREAFAKATDRDLIAQHNLTEDNLAHALRRYDGKLPVPSIAITKKHTPMRGFGEITLLGDANLIDPRGPNRTKVFGADIYSPRHPDVDKHFDAKPLREYAEKMLKKWGWLTGKSTNVFDVRDQVVEDLNERGSINAPWPLAEFLESEGHATIPEIAAQLGGSNDEAIVMLRRMLRSRVTSPDYTYSQWKANLRDSLPGKERFFKGYNNQGDRRYAAATLNNVMRELKRNLRGGEVQSMMYGAGQIRALLTPQFRSRKQISAEKDKRLVDERSFDSDRNNADEILRRIGERVFKTYSEPMEMAAGFLNDAAKTGLAAAERSLDKPLTEAQRHEIKLFLDYLRNLPTEYFEAKITGPVDIGQFAAAVVPSDIKPETRRALEQRGLQIIEYNRAGGESQGEGIARATQQVERTVFASRPRLDQQGRPIPEGQQDLPGLDTGAREDQQAPDFALEQPEGQVRPPSQSRLFASRPSPFPESRVQGVVYHGSQDSGPINSWRTPAYFSNSRDFARGFGQASMQEVYLDIRNPYEINGETDGRHFDWDRADVRRMKAEGHDGVIIRHPNGDVYTVFDRDQIMPANRTMASRPTGDQFQGPPGFGSNVGAEAPLPGPGAPIEVGGGEYQLGQFRGLSDNEQRILVSVMGDLDQAVEGQRRGTRDWDQTEKAALTMLQRRFGLTLDSLVNRKKGSTANAEQLEAYGMLMAQTTREVKQLSDQVAQSRNPSSEQYAALHSARERLGMLIAPAMGYATEAGRSLNILRKVSGDLKDANQILEALGDGSEAAIRKFAKAVNQAGSIDQVIGVVRASYTPNLWDKFYEVWINGLLSGPTTHAVNMTSNGIFSMLEMGAEALASVVSPSVPMASVAARVAAVPHGVTLGLKNGRLAWTEERAVLTPEDKLETHQKAIEGTVGKLVRIPGRALGAEDEFFKGINYTGQLAALAMDEAVAQNPDNPREAFDRIMGNIQSRPDLIKKAKDHAARLTFTSPLGDVGRVAMSFANSRILGMRPLRLIIPFIRTPTNILKRAIEYTPAAPLFEQVRKDLSGGGRDAAMAWSRMAVGSTIAMSVMALAAQGIMSGAGPEDDDERALLMRKGWRPYSIRMPDGSWVKYNRFEPAGMILGIAADLYELSGPLKQGEYEKLAAMLMTSIATNLGDKTFLRGITDAAQAYTDPQRYMARWAQGLVSSGVPNIIGQTARWQDPFQREARTMLDAIRAKIPGQSERLARRLDIAGDPIERDTGAPGNPFQVGKPRQDVLADTMLHLGVAKNAPSRTMVVAGKSFELRDQDYESYKAFVQKARWSTLTPLVSSPQFRQLASANPQGAAMLLDKQYDDIGRQARMMWLFQNSRVLVPKQPGSSSLATSYR